MGAVASFDYDKFIARYPEFSQTGSQPVSADLAQAYFDEATVYHRNDGSGPVATATTQLVLLNMLVAHLASLNTADGAGTPASSAPGRVTSASEGSVSVSTEYKGPDSAAWFTQTRYGAAYWQATAVYRTMRYIPGAGASRTFGRYPNTRQF